MRAHRVIIAPPVPMIAVVTVAVAVAVVGSVVTVAVADLVAVVAVAADLVAVVAAGSVVVPVVVAAWTSSLPMALTRLTTRMLPACAGSSQSAARSSHAARLAFPRSASAPSPSLLSARGISRCSPSLQADANNNEC